MIRTTRIVIIVSLAFSAMVAAYVDIEDEVMNWWRLGLDHYSSSLPYKSDTPESNEYSF